MGVTAKPSGYHVEYYVVDLDQRDQQPLTFSTWDEARAHVLFLKEKGIRARIGGGPRDLQVDDED